MRTLYVYILASRSRTLYTGVTGNLPARLMWHRQATTGFVARYSCTRLVYFEATSSPRAALDRETQIKRWRRAKKLALITAFNPAWDDLAVTMHLLDDDAPRSADSSTPRCALRSE